MQSVSRVWMQLVVPQNFEDRWFGWSKFSWDIAWDLWLLFHSGI